MKKFMYFQNTDGGMDAFNVSAAGDFTNLYGWMRSDCVLDDLAMVEWMDTADVGEVHEHRLGYLVRIKEKP